VITIYGSARSRVSRSIVALEELRLPYRHVPLNPRARPEDRAAIDALNPNRHVPVLDDGDLRIWESMAINLYLGDRYGAPPLWPAEVQQRARVYQWTLWSQTEMDRRDWDLARRGADPEQIDMARAAKIRTLAVLDAALAQQPYLLGNEFSFADLNVAATISQPNEAGLIDWDRLDPFAHALPALGDWLRRCTSRASWQRVAELE
jgi:glutathione S-transferase